MTNSADATSRYEADREGKAAFSAYLSLRRALDSLDRALASGEPSDDDGRDTMEGRLAAASRSFVSAAERYEPASVLVGRVPETLDRAQLAVLAEGIRTLLDGMASAGLGRQPDAIRYLPDTERDRSVLGRSLSLLADAAPAFRDAFPGISVGVFGSVARGEDTPASDLDLLLDANGGSIPLATQVRVEVSLREALSPVGRELDVVVLSELRPEYLRAVRTELVPAIGPDIPGKHPAIQSEETP